MSIKPMVSKEVEAAEWAGVLDQIKILEDEVKTGVIHINESCLRVPVTINAVYMRMQNILSGHRMTPEHSTELLQRNTALLDAARLQEIARSQAQPAKTEATPTTADAAEATATAASAAANEEPQTVAQNNPETPLASTSIVQQVLNEIVEMVIEKEGDPRPVIAPTPEEQRIVETEIPIEKAPLQETAIAASAVQEPQQRSGVSDEKKPERKEEPLTASTPEVQQNNGATGVVEDENFVSASESEEESDNTNVVPTKIRQEAQTTSVEKSSVAVSAPKETRIAQRVAKVTMLGAILGTISLGIMKISDKMSPRFEEPCSTETFASQFPPAEAQENILPPGSYPILVATTACAVIAITAKLFDTYTHKTSK